MERYDGYKESGVDWIGEMPSSWSISKIKYIGSYVNGYAFKPADWSSKGLPIIRIQDLTGSNEAPNRFEGTLDEKYLIEDGDLLVSWAATIGAFRWSGHKGWLNQHIFKVIPNENLCTKKYAYWLFDSSVKELDHANKHGIMMAHLTASVFNSFTVPLPPLNEQDAIAQWLEIEVNRVEKTIDSCLKSVSLLNEYRQSIITEAVTHGLDPSAPMKPSGIEWMGDIPENWNTSRGKAVFAEKDIRSETGEEELLTVSHITGVTPRSVKNVNMFMAESLVGYKVCEVGDIAANTMWLWQGAIGVAPTRGVISYSYSVYRQLNNAYDDHFLDYLLRSNAMVSAYCANSTGITKSRLRLYPDKFLTLKWPIPPMSEQKSIAAYLDAKTAEIDTLIASKTRQVELLREYRKSIISEAVTGKFKVPGLE